MPAPEAPIIATLEALEAYLTLPDTIARYPRLSGLAVNLFEDPEQTQYPLLDIHPLSETPIGSDDYGRIAEDGKARFQFVIQVDQSDYRTAVRQAFGIAEDLRLALNTNAAARTCGVAWIRREEVQQVEPQVDGDVAYISVQGRITAMYDIQAK